MIFPSDAQAWPGDNTRASGANSIRFLAHGPLVWCVDQGYVDLFVTRLDAAGASGRQHYLFRLQAGEILFGVPASAGGPGLCATKGGSAKLRCWDFAQFCATVPSPTARVRLIERWVEALSQVLTRRTQPPVCETILAGEAFQCKGKATVRSASGLVWVEQRRGTSRLFGQDELTLQPGQVVPLPAGGWLELEGDASLSCYKTEQIGSERLEDVLSAFHQLALHGFAARLRSTDLEEIDHAATRSIARRTALQKALFRILSALGTPTSEDTALSAARLESANDLLFAAAHSVGRALGVEVKPSPFPYRTPREGLEHIARVSQFRIRRVRLSEGWWQHDQGPLIGFLKPDTPVALLPRGPAAYEIFDPTTGTRTRASSRSVQSLAPTAYTCYRALPNRPSTLLELLAIAARPCRKDFAVVLGFGVAGGVLTTATPLAIGVLINSIIPGAARDQLLNWTLLLVTCALTSAVFQAVRSIALVRIEMRMGCAVQAAVWDRLLGQPPSFFRAYSAGDLATRASGLDTIRQTLSGATLRALLSGVFSIFNFALLFYYSATLALAGVGLIAVAVAVTSIVSYLQLRIQRQLLTLRAKGVGLVLQLLTGISKIRVAGAEARAFGVWATLFSHQRGALLAIRRISNAFAVFHAAFPILTHVVLFSVVLQLSNSQQPMRTGDFVAFMAAFSGCISATLGAAGAVIFTLGALPAYELARPILLSTPEATIGRADPGTLAGHIVADHVSFKYDVASAPTLDDVSFEAKPGEFVAFVGPSGSGKSTILRLLLGFDTPRTGNVYYDGHELRSLDVHAVRRQIGVVLQAGRMMPGDLYTNIVGCSSASMKDAWEAARLAGLADDIRAMPMGMHTVVSEMGVTLSGGQRQRLLIARAIVSQPRLLFLDEATSALDNRTQTVVGQSLNQMRSTRLVVAHRLSTILNADRIYVVDRGRIVQTGRYEELIAQSGLFSELARRQLA